MLKAYGWLTFCVVVWGSNFVFGKILVEDFSPGLITSLRLLFIVLCLVGITVYKKNFKLVSKSDVLQTADPTTSAIILAMTPILTGLLAALFLKEKLTFRMLMGSILAIIGIYFVVVKGGTSSLHFDKGLLWIVVTMISFAIMIIMTRVLSQRIDPLTITLYSNLVGFIVSIPFAFSPDCTNQSQV